LPRAGKFNFALALTGDRVKVSKSGKNKFTTNVVAVVAKSYAKWLVAQDKKDGTDGGSLAAVERQQTAPTYERIVTRLRQSQCVARLRAIECTLDDVPNATSLSFTSTRQQAPPAAAATTTTTIATLSNGELVLPANALDPVELKRAYVAAEKQQRKETSHAAVSDEARRAVWQRVRMSLGIATTACSDAQLARFMADFCVGAAFDQRYADSTAAAALPDKGMIENVRSAHSKAIELAAAKDAADERKLKLHLRLMRQVYQMDHLPDDSPETWAVAAFKCRQRQEIVELVARHFKNEETQCETQLSQLQAEMQALIKQAYQTRSRIHHPDKHTSKTEAERNLHADFFRGAKQAYTVLSSPTHKHKYDVMLATNVDGHRLFVETYEAKLMKEEAMQAVDEKDKLREQAKRHELRKKQATARRAGKQETLAVATPGRVRQPTVKARRVPGEARYQFTLRLGGVKARHRISRRVCRGLARRVSRTIVEGATTTATVDSTISGGEFVFRVHAFNMYGRGPASAEAHIVVAQLQTAAEEEARCARGR
jgi:hypothetical protein